MIVDQSHRLELFLAMLCSCYLAFLLCLRIALGVFIVGFVASSIALNGSGTDEFWFRLSTFVRLESLSLVGSPSKTCLHEANITAALLTRRNRPVGVRHNLEVDSET